MKLQKNKGKERHPDKHEREHSGSPSSLLFFFLYAQHFLISLQNKSKTKPLPFSSVFSHLKLPSSLSFSSLLSAALSSLLKRPELPKIADRLALKP